MGVTVQDVQQASDLWVVRSRYGNPHAHKRLGEQPGLEPLMGLCVHMDQKADDLGRP